MWKNILLEPRFLNRKKFLLVRATLETFFSIMSSRANFSANLKILNLNESRAIHDLCNRVERMLFKHGRHYCIFCKLLRNVSARDALLCVNKQVAVKCNL